LRRHFCKEMFMGYVITTDMTADMADNFLKENDIDVVSMPYTIGGVEYGRDNAQDYPVFYNEMRGGALTSTSQADIFDAEQVFIKHLERGEDIIHICFSSGMSGSYDNLWVLSKTLMSKYPGRQIAVIDSLSGAGGEGIFVYYAKKRKDAGASFDELVNWCNENKLNFRHYFIVDDLNHLKRGGRISKIEAAIGTILGIKPILDLSYSGKIIPLQKAMGRNKAIQAMLELTKKNIYLDENDFVLVGHGDCIEEARLMGSKISSALGGIAIKYCFVNYLVGAHAGPNSLAIFFYGSKRKKLLPVP
jgi:EDD domain protein, DegV family